MYRLLVSGERSCFTTLAFNEDAKTLDVLENYQAPYNASWIEPSSTAGSTSRLIGLSEGDESGLLYTFEIDHSEKQCRITSQQPTRGAPAHFVTLRDQSAVALATYMGGSIALYPISNANEASLTLTESPQTEILPPFPYEQDGHGPDKKRQRQCHVHQIIEDRRGLLYAPDLGSDRVWILRQDNMVAEICGWLQCPLGSGPRHGVLTPDENTMYVIGELSHKVIAFDLSTIEQSTVLGPIDGFQPSVIPPSVPSAHEAIMDSSEILLHPSVPNILYVSNRWERHIDYSGGDAQEQPSGDSIAVILLSNDGREVEKIKHVRTGLDVIRGMRFSPDGRHLAAVGQEGGGVEIYQVGGSRADELSLVASLRDGLDGGIKHAVWL